MEDYDTEGYISESDPNVSADKRYTSYTSRPSAASYRNIRAQTNSRVMHLAKRLLADNGPRTHNEALKILVLLLRSIPPKGYLGEDLFQCFVHLLQRNGEHGVLFQKFLSVAGSTTPYLRPMILVHGARRLASENQIYEMKHLIQRNCKDWHLEKHQVARYYKWIIMHAESICSDSGMYNADYRVELEHVLMTYADLKMLPNQCLFQIFIESHTEYPEKVKVILDLFISLFPRIHFLRKYRIEHCSEAEQGGDIISLVHDSAYAKSAILLAVERRGQLSLREFLLLLFDITLSEPNNPVNWENLLYHLLTEAPIEETLDIIEDLFANELRRAQSAFTSGGTLASYLRDSCMKYYLATAKIVLLKDMGTYDELYQRVKSATGATLERKYMEGNNPIWRHFKQLPKSL